MESDVKLKDLDMTLRYETWRLKLLIETSQFPSSASIH